jgi:hypothetical protein
MDRLVGLGMRIKMIMGYGIWEIGDGISGCQIKMKGTWGVLALSLAPTERGPYR